MRAASVLVLLAPALAAADDTHRVTVGLDVFEYFPTLTVEPTAQPQSFGSPKQHTGITEIDVPVAIGMTPWLRVVPLVGFTDLSLGWNEAGDPSLAGLDQNALVLGAGAQAFYRYAGWEVRADVRGRAPIPIGNASAGFFGMGSYDGHVDGGESIALTVGGARRLGPTAIFIELGYIHSLVAFSASALGVSESFGGFLIGGGVSLW